MSTHNLCFGAKIRKIGIPLHTPVLLYKSGVQGGYTLHGHVFVMISITQASMCLSWLFSAAIRIFIHLSLLSGQTLCEISTTVNSITKGAKRDPFCRDYHGCLPLPPGC